MTTNQKNNRPLHIVLGASRGSGLAVVKELQNQGKNVIGVSSSGYRPPGLDIEFIKADAADSSELAVACSDADYIYNCLNVSYDKWKTFLPLFADNVIKVAEKTGAKVIYIDNLYSYGPVESPMTETMSNNASDEKGILRGRLSELYINAHKKGLIKLLIAKAPDFFGPATTSLLGDAVFKKALNNQTAMNIGDPDKLHSYLFTEDLAKAVVFLAEKEIAYGQVWHLPCNPPITTRQFIETVYKKLGKNPKLQSLNKFSMRLLSPFVPVFKELVPLYYQRDRDYVVDFTKFKDTFKDAIQVTPFDVAIESTLNYYKSL